MGFRIHSTTPVEWLRERQEAMKLTDEQEQWLNDLQTAVDWLRVHPECHPEYGGLRVSRWVYPETSAEYGKDEEGQRDYSIIVNKDERDAEVKQQVAAIARKMGSCEKDYDSETFSLRKQFGKHIVEVMSSRDAVCERIVTGTVEREVVDYKNAPTITKTEEVVEWRCSPLLADTK